MLQVKHFPSSDKIGVQILGPTSHVMTYILPPGVTDILYQNTTRSPVGG